MRNKDAFSGYHPTINFLYFALVLLFSMCLMHPVYLAISLTGALTYDIYLKGRKAVRFAVMGLLPMAVFAALVNPAFNHEGQTILTYLPSGNPLTLESMFYGVAAAVMLASVVLWFSSYNEVMTSDKFVYLFGRVIPALSLVLSMALRFIPKFKAQMQVVSEAQACIGRDTKNGSVIRRVGNAVKIFSIMVTWSLENAIETADSMRSRGYGLPGRTAFSIYRFDDRDKTALAWLIFCGAYILSGWLAGGTYFRYYPYRENRRMDAADRELHVRVSGARSYSRDSRPKGGQAVEVFTIRNLTFAYPEQEKNAISDLTLSVQPGEFLVLCGPSGCGKSTLLRQLKTVLAPHGRRSEKSSLTAEILTRSTSANRLKKSALCSKVPKTRS
ncbi:MAG: ATP-binding cassette domain-containing protein [Oscillospiraceae bacterium]